MSLISWSTKSWSCYLPSSLLSRSWTPPSHGCYHWRCLQPSYYQPDLFGRYETQQGSSICGDHLCQNVVISALLDWSCEEKKKKKTLLDCFYATALVVWTLLGWLKSQWGEWPANKGVPPIIQKKTSPISFWSGSLQQTSTRMLPPLVCSLLLTYKLSAGLGSVPRQSSLKETDCLTPPCPGPSVLNRPCISTPALHLCELFHHTGHSHTV